MTENGQPAWPEVPLSDLLQALESGSRPKGGVRGITDGVPSLGGEHIASDGGFRLENVKYVPREFFDRMSRGKIQIDDVLIVKDGATTGKVALVRDDFPLNEAAVNEHVFLCRLKPGVDPEYIFYFLFSKEGQRRLLQNFRGSAQGGINQSFAPNTLVPLPPDTEQQRVVERLRDLTTRFEPPWVWRRPC
jgi:type I restriction enzyme S subunit